MKRKKVGSSLKRPIATNSSGERSLPKALETAPATQADWYLRAAAYWNDTLRMSFAALWCLRVGAVDYARQIAEAAFAQLEKRDPVRRDIDHLARISYVFERIGDGRRAAEALDKARQMLSREED